MAEMAIGMVEREPAGRDGRVLEWGRQEGKAGSNLNYYVALWNNNEDQTAHFYLEFETREQASDEFHEERRRRAAAGQA